MGLKRHPKRNNFIGVHWTQWPWPSLVAKAIYRRYLPKPMDPESQYRRSMYHRLSLAYFCIAWTFVGMVVYYSVKGKPENGEESKGLYTKTMDWAPYVIRKDTLEKDKIRVINYKIKGFTVVEKKDITDELIAKKREIAEEKLLKKNE